MPEDEVLSVIVIPIVAALIAYILLGAFIGEEVPSSDEMELKNHVQTDD